MVSRFVKSMDRYFSAILAKLISQFLCNVRVNIGQRIEKCASATNYYERQIGILNDRQAIGLTILAVGRYLKQCRQVIRAY